MNSGKDSPVTWLATWGEQVVAPGATATEEIRGQNLGLAVLTGAQGAKLGGDATNHLVKFNLKGGSAAWYAMAAWDQEASNRKIGYWNETEKEQHPSLVLPPDGIKSRQQFLNAVKEQADRMEMPSTFRILSSGASAQPAPADSLVPHMQPRQ